MAVKVPGAAWDPLGPQTQPPMRAHDIVVVHTMAGYFEGTDIQFHANGYKGLESHLGYRADGYRKQWQDLEYQADANGDGNPNCISLETEDHGPEFGPWSGSNVPPWTDKQLDALVEDITWICDKYNIPKVLIPDTKPGRRGIGYHRQGIPGNYPGPFKGLEPGGVQWSKATGKACPGDRRIRQLIDIVIPRVQGRGGFLMALDSNEQDDLYAKVKDVNDGDFIDRGKPARANFKTLLIGAMGTGLTPVREDDEKPEPGQGSLIAPFKRIMREVLAEQEENTPDAPA